MKTSTALLSLVAILTIIAGGLIHSPFLAGGGIFAFVALWWYD